MRVGRGAYLFQMQQAFGGQGEAGFGGAVRQSRGYVSQAFVSPVPSGAHFYVALELVARGGRSGIEYIIYGNEVDGKEIIKTNI